jgi:diguanylate cyclase (GGDEF)-like protein
VGRFGGDEFLVVVLGCGMAQALAQAERLREVVCAQPVTFKDLSINVTVSVGVATRCHPTQHDLEALIASADQALYRAKAGGRNRVEGEGAANRPSAPPDSGGRSDPA